MRIALAGNPNSGKTTLFNSLTGSTAHVGNWPGVTVEKRSGVYKKNNINAEIIDLPGIYSLSPYTPEEVVSRNYILDENPDCVINVVDATNLERNLYLTTQILEIDVPVVIALNMSDVVKRNGDYIDVDSLSKELGVPVVEISALKSTNLDTLMEMAAKATEKERKGFTVIKDKALSHLIRDVEIAFKGKGVKHPLFHAIKLVEMDELEVASHPDLIGMVEEFKKTFENDVFGDDFEALVADARYQYISKHYSNLFHKNNENEGKDGKLSLSDKIDRVLTHRIRAIPIFIAIMFFIFHFTFSEDLFFMNRWFGLNISSEGAVNFFTGMGYAGLAEEGPVSIGVPSLGVFLQNWFGWLTGSFIDVVRGWFAAGGVENTWYCSLLCDGVLAGLDAVLSFIPQILMLFLFIAILEDSGYMARVAFILDRAFRKFGLSGKAFIPMLSGFGCSVPAIMATRTLEDEREKNRTIRLMTCFSCGAKAPLWALLAAVGAMAGFAGDIFVFTIYIGGIAVAIIYALFMKLFSKDQYVSPFIMELPAYHLPQARNVAAHLWEKFKHYVHKAVTIIAAATVVIWFLKSFGWDESGSFAFLLKLDEETGEYILLIDRSILAYLGRGLSYFYYPLGWWHMADGYAFDETWKYSVSTITGLIAKEDVVATMAELELVEETINLSTAATYSFAVYNLFTLPCFAAIGAAYGEQNKKEFAITLAWWFVMSYAAAALIFWMGYLFETIWYVGLIVLLVLIAIIVLVGLYVSKKHKVSVKA